MNRQINRSWFLLRLQVPFWSVSHPYVSVSFDAVVQLEVVIHSSSVPAILDCRFRAFFWTIPVT